MNRSGKGPRVFKMKLPGTVNDSHGTNDFANRSTLCPRTFNYNLPGTLNERFKKSFVQ